MDSSTADPTTQTQPAAPASAAPTPDNSGAGEGSGSSSWSGAASGASSPIDQQTQPQPQAKPPAAPPANANATPVAAPPPTAAPVRPKGIRGFIDRMVDSLAGTDTSRVRKEPDGTLYIQHETPTRGQQWLRIASEGFRGAAAGMAAGKGAGNQGKALEAGIEAGDKQHDQSQEQYKEQQLAVANSQTLKHQMAANAFAMTRLQVKAAQEDQEFSQKQQSFFKDNGGVTIGHVTDLSGMAKLMRDTPNFHQDQVQHDLMQPVQTYDQDGKANGFEVYRMPQGYGEETTPPGTEFSLFNAATGKMETQKTTEWTPKSKIAAYNNAAGVASQDYSLKQADIAQKSAEAKKSAAGPQETSSETALHRAEAFKDIQEGKAATEKATGGTLDDATIDMIGQGRAGSIPALQRLLSKDPQALAKVAQKYPGFDTNKVQSYLKSYEDFTSGKVAEQIKSGGAVFQHLAELQRLNTPMSHVPHTNAWTDYQNQLDTLAPELAKFYGDSTIPGIESYKKTLGSTLPGNRQTAIQRQAHSMGSKFDEIEQQWRNAAPSAAYQAPVPGVSLEAKESRGALDPSYAARATVRMKAPNGEISTVPLKDTTHYLQAGATVDE